jgi:hypothetical protein
MAASPISDALDDPSRELRNRTSETRPYGVWSRTGILPVTSSARKGFHTANPLLKGQAAVWPATRTRRGVAYEIQFDKVLAGWILNRQVRST